MTLIMTHNGLHMGPQTPRGVGPIPRTEAGFIGKTAYLGHIPGKGLFRLFTGVMSPCQGKGGFGP